jgi:hypothetical protein
VEPKTDPLPRDGPRSGFEARVSPAVGWVDAVMLTCSCCRFVPPEVTEACTKLFENFVNVGYMVNITENK